MTNRFPLEIQELIRERMATGLYSSEEDVLRAALHALADEDDLRGIQEAIAELQAGDEGTTLADAAKEILREFDAGRNNPC